MKMLDMIRKHTAEGSGNWRTVCTMIERTQEMLRMTKEVNKSFVCLFLQLKLAIGLALIKPQGTTL